MVSQLVGTAVHCVEELLTSMLSGSRLGEGVLLYWAVIRSLSRQRLDWTSPGKLPAAKVCVEALETTSSPN